MNEITLRTGYDLDSHRVRDPRQDWPDEAKSLFLHLAGIYPEGDPLPNTAGSWCARQKSRNTRRGYSRGYRRWDEYSRSSGIHPYKANLALADAYNNYLERVPMMIRVKGGGYREGPPMADSSRANHLSAVSSFYDYSIMAETTESNPFSFVSRPNIDQDYSSTKGFTEDELGSLIRTAKEYSERSFALILILYFTGPRIDSILSLDVDKIDYDRGHNILVVKIKGNKTKKIPMPPIVYHAVMTYLGGRTSGPLFITRSGARWTSDQVWKHLRFLARRAGIPQAKYMKPHMLRHQFITDSLDKKVPLEIVQDAAGHRDPRTTQRYNRRRDQLERHPAHVLVAQGVPGIS